MSEKIRPSAFVERLRTALKTPGHYVDTHDVSALLDAYDERGKVIAHMHEEAIDRERQCDMDELGELVEILRGAKVGTIDNALKALGNCMKAADAINDLRYRVYTTWRAKENYKDALTKEMRDRAKAMVEADDLRSKLIRVQAANSKAISDAAREKLYGPVREP